MRRLSENSLTVKLLNLLLTGNLDKLKKDKFSYLDQILNILNILNERANLESLLDKSNEKIANYEVNEIINREMNAEQNEKAEEVKIALSKIGSLRRSLIDLLTVEKIKKFK